jgi:geranylgeranyl diphosphate synthase type I
MADVANGHRRTPATEQEIIDVYRFKTGRYTFSLPLMLGAIYAAEPAAVVDGLSRWGEIEGVVFQIRDDQLGIMGDTGEIGKPAGTDITSDKQTLHRFEFMNRTAGTRWEPLQAHFGGERLTQTELDEIRVAMRDSGALAALQDRISDFRRQAAHELDALELNEAQRSALDAIDEFNATRSV